MSPPAQDKLDWKKNMPYLSSPTSFGDFFLQSLLFKAKLKDLAHAERLKNVVI